MKHTIEIPITPISLNEWNILHWAKRYKLKREWEKWIWGLSKEAGRSIPHYRKIKVSARIYFTDRFRRDTDNYSAILWKLTNDGLVKAGVIDDDSPEYVEISVPELIVSDKEKTVIVIEGEEETA